LTGHVLLHVFQKSENDLLVICDVSLVLTFLLLILNSELIDFLLLLVKDLILLRVFILSRLGSARYFVLDVFNVLLVSLNHLSHVRNLLLLLLDLSIVLLNSVHQSLTGLWEGQIHFVGL
jgi:hypothetical protein